MWSVLSLLSFLAFIIFTILGFISLFKKKGTTKRRFLCSVACFIVFIVSIAFVSQSETNTVANKAEVASAVDSKGSTDKSVQADDDKAQQAVLNFEKSFYAVEQNSSPVFDNYKKAMLGLSDGSSDILTAYDAAKQAKKESNTMMYNFEKIQTPKSVSKEIRNLLDGAKSDIKMAYSFKEDAYKSIMKYIDDQNVSDMSKSQEYMEQADQYTLSGLSKIIEAKSKVGIDITPENK